MSLIGTWGYGGSADRVIIPDIEWNVSWNDSDFSTQVSDFMFGLDSVIDLTFIQETIDTTFNLNQVIDLTFGLQIIDLNFTVGVIP